MIPAEDFDLGGVGLPPSTALEDPPPDPAQAAVVTDTWVVRAVVIGLTLAALAVVVTSAILAAIGAPGLPGELTAIAPTSVGALGALLAGTLTKRA